MKKLILLLLILPFFFACKDDASSSSEPETKPKPVIQAKCGNGRWDDGEQCDDGNIDDGDGCSSTCKREQPARCGDGIVDETEDLSTCPDDASYCGDGICYTDNETEENCPCDCRAP